MKSRTTSAILTILFGPLGLFYTTVWGAIALTVIAFVSATTLVGPLFAWVVSIFWGDSLVKKHNLSPNVHLAQQPKSEVATIPAPVQGPSSEKKGASLIPGQWEILVYAAVVLFLVFLLPDLMGRPEGVGAIDFYMSLIDI